jgi:hypothetical protein
MLRMVRRRQPGSKRHWAIEEVGMALTIDTLRVMAQEYLGVELEPAILERLLPLVERQMARMRELQAIDLGEDDPRTMPYINDLRLLHYD